MRFGHPASAMSRQMANDRLSAPKSRNRCVEPTFAKGRIRPCTVSLCAVAASRSLSRAPRPFASLGAGPPQPNHRRAAPADAPPPPDGRVLPTAPSARRGIRLTVETDGIGQTAAALPSQRADQRAPTAAPDPISLPARPRSPPATRPIRSARMHNRHNGAPPVSPQHLGLYSRKVLR